MFDVLFFCLTFYIIFGIINLFIYIIYKFIQYIFNCITNTNKYKENYDKKILSQAISKVFLSYIRKNIQNNISYTDDVILMFSNIIYQNIDDKIIINNDIKKYFKDNIWILYNITYPKYEYYGFNYEEYKFNHFKRITDNIIDNLDYKIDEILEEYRKLKNNY